jgi:hypothetical protein
MAKIVLGLGSAHSPMLSLGGDRWSEYGERDKANPMLTAVPGGEVMTYEECSGTSRPWPCWTRPTRKPGSLPSGADHPMGRSSHTAYMTD